MCSDKVELRLNSLLHLTQSSAAERSGVRWSVKLGLVIECLMGFATLYPSYRASPYPPYALARLRSVQSARSPHLLQWIDALR